MKPLTAFTIILCIFAIGEFVAVKTKALLSAMLVGALILLVSYRMEFDAKIMEVAGISQISLIFIGILLLTSIGTLIYFPVTYYENTSYEEFMINTLNQLKEYLDSGVTYVRSLETINYLGVRLKDMINRGIISGAGIVA